MRVLVGQVAWLGHRSQTSGADAVRLRRGGSQHLLCCGGMFSTKGGGLGARGALQGRLPYQISARRSGVYAYTLLLHMRGTAACPRLLCLQQRFEGDRARACRGADDLLNGGAAPAVHPPVPRGALTLSQTDGLVHGGMSRSTVAPRSPLVLPAMLGRGGGPEPAPEASDMRQVLHSLTLSSVITVSANSFILGLADIATPPLPAASAV